jgi:hypothetical protein
MLPERFSVIRSPNYGFANWNVLPYMSMSLFSPSFRPMAGLKSRWNQLIFIADPVSSKVKLSLCLTKHHTLKAYWGSGGIAPRILDLGTRWRWVASFTPWPLYPQGKSPWYPLDRRLGGPQSHFGRGSSQENTRVYPKISGLAVWS